MFRVFKNDGTELGVAESILYIKIGSSGCFTPCTASEAIGIAFDSIPYNFVGEKKIENVDEADFEEISLSRWLAKKDTTAMQELAAVIEDVYNEDLANIEA